MSSDRDADFNWRRYPRVNFKHGQELFFSSSDAAQKYFDSPRDYWLSPHELPLPGMDGKRGLPDLRNETLSTVRTLVKR